MYCGLNTASVVFLIFYYPTIPIFECVSFLFAPFSEEPEVSLPKYSQTAILHSAHFQRVVNTHFINSYNPLKRKMKSLVSILYVSDMRSFNQTPRTHAYLALSLTHTAGRYNPDCLPPPLVSVSLGISQGIL